MKEAGTVRASTRETYLQELAKLRAKLVTTFALVGKFS